MALEGTLEDFSLADIFQLIGIQRKTGILTLKNSQETVSVTFHHGMVVGADSVPKKLEDRIGKVLVKTGLITQDGLTEALELQQKTLQKIGFILVDRNYISRDQLKEALQIQVTQMIYRLFRWTTGEYYFDQKAKVDPEAAESIPPVSAESILMEGIHMIDEWPVIEKKISNTNLIFRPMISAQDLELDDQDGGDRSDTDRIRLSREEYSVYLLVNGMSTVAEVVEGSKLGEFHTCKALYDLLERRIIEPAAATPRINLQPTISIRAQKEGIDFARFAFPILAAVILGAVVLGIRDPLKVPLSSFFDAKDEADLKARLNDTRLNQLDSSIMMYFYVHGSLPAKLDELVENNYLREEDILDPWSRPYMYDVSEDTYILAGSNAGGEVVKRSQIRRTVGRMEEVPPPPPKKKPEATIRFEN
ncbi:DUF4388 domain-containing protein [bacterium]|nr:DUF4388 domain-containing protein [bacterium]MCI0606001.1 DUF4388 domain-containing protein [bacterium]